MYYVCHKEKTPIVKITKIKALLVNIYMVASKMEQSMFTPILGYFLLDSHYFTSTFSHNYWCGDMR
jgi:hypothetical protein